MQRSRVFILLAVIGLCLGWAAATAAQPGASAAVTKTLQDISRIENRTVTPAQLIDYSYHEVLDDFFTDCGTNQPLVIRYYIVNVTTDEGNQFVYHVSSDLVYFKQCSHGRAQPTSTPTINLTRTTATPSPTPTASFTPSNTPTATDTFTPTMTFTPSDTPTPTETPRPGAAHCAGFLYSRLMVGEQGRVLPGGDPNRLRDQPSADAAQVGVIPPEQTFDVLQGPECDPAGRAWWRVRYLKTEGWTVEGEGQIYYVEPIIPPTATLFPTNTPPAATQALTATEEPSGTPKG